MTDSSSNPGAGKKKELGTLNPGNQRIRDNAIKAIFANWKISDLNEAFPANIKPKSLGSSAIGNIKNISNRRSLAEAQALFLRECMDEKGAHVPLSFVHTEKVLKALKEADAAVPKEANGTANGVVNKSNTQKPAAETPKQTTLSGAPEDSGDLVIPGSSIQPPKKIDENQPPRFTSHAVGITVPKKTLQVPGEASKSTSAKSSSSAEARSPLASKKRCLAAKIADEYQQQESPAAKKARKENEPTLLEVSQSLPGASVALPLKSGTLAHSTAVSSIAHPRSDDDPLAELDKIMETNRKENEKLFNASIPKLAPVVAADYSDTIVVDVGARQDRSQSLEPFQRSKTERTRSASPLKSTPRKALAEDSSGKSKAWFDRCEDSGVELSAPKLTVTTTDKPATKSSKKDNVAPPIKKSSARASTTQMHEIVLKPKEPKGILADAVAAAGRGTPLQESGLREHCSNIQEILKDFMNRGLVKLARPDQQALADDLGGVFATTLRHLEADIDWVFKKDGESSAET